MRIPLTLVVAMIGTVATACNIPVFRYALERWQPDACEIIVFHDEEVSTSDAARMRRLQNDLDRSGANASLVHVDTSGAMSAEHRDLWKDLNGNKQPTLPYLLARTTIGRSQIVNHWHQTLSESSSRDLLESPARAELAKRLMAGHSVVWVMVTSPDAERTQAAKKLLENSFTHLEQTIRLPEGIGLPGSELYADIPLVVRFSLLEIAHDDPAESFLTSLLTGIRRQAFLDGEPLLVPVFGRGRALEVIPAGDFSAALMEDLTLFLSGACSCQVKEQNPGFDLLISADWDTALFGDEENRPPDRTSEEGKNREPVLLTIPPGR
ncbi:hypothetical protein [Neorhodopirellula pilleata]|uniref:Lipoprotein n=1 Tax=Neorhodopirellula pilleata TaxID=2714738 RepID=A0A5C5ZZZ5_9BACT|nr:hypothetical protein [Neorhodopirellula pilleata]TWT92627.1 hypothetical protein Pla100_46470 [Neorhodopirellula pilleata]